MRKNKVHNVSAKEARDTVKTSPAVTDGENDAAAVIQGLIMISVFGEPVYLTCHRKQNPACVGIPKITRNQ